MNWTPRQALAAADYQEGRKTIDQLEEEFGVPKTRMMLREIKKSVKILCGACDEPVVGKAHLFQQHDKNNFAHYTFCHPKTDCANVFDDIFHISMGAVTIPENVKADRR